MEKEILQKLIEQNAILCDIKSSLEKLSTNIENLETVKIIHEHTQSQRNHLGRWEGGGGSYWSGYASGGIG